jgi:RNA polymerase sigma-70 factor, ECF subfamily
MTDSEAALIARVVAHDDRAAFELLVRRYQSPVRNFLRRLTRDDADRANDLAQDTFIKLYHSIATYRAQAKFQTWLYRIAYNVFLNDLRGRVVETELTEADHAATPDAAQAAGDEADVASALAHLNDRQRAVFDLHYQKGMTHQEIAGALELPLGTVKSDLTRGLEYLRKILTKESNGHGLHRRTT